MKTIKICILLLFVTAGVSAQTGALCFNADKKLKIVQFTDIHWIPGNENSEIAATNMNAVLDAEKPDLVIFTGDLAYGSPAKEALDRALEPVISHGVPYVVTWGNHDDEHDMTRKELSEYIKDKPGNIGVNVDGISGTANYVLPIKSATTDSIASVIYVFDSHSYRKIDPARGYAWISLDQINWYVATSRAYTEQNGGAPLPSLAFFHIPFPEYNQAAASENAFLTGTRGEPACSPQANSGLFTAMLEQGDVMATFVGHDHNNDYAVLWKGILLCYGRYSGGKTVYNDLPGGNGARIIEIEEGKRQVTTWIRLKDGCINYLQH